MAEVELHAVEARLGRPPRRAREVAGDPRDLGFVDRAREREGLRREHARGREALAPGAGGDRPRVAGWMFAAVLRVPASVARSLGRRVADHDLAGRALSVLRHRAVRQRGHGDTAGRDRAVELDQIVADDVLRRAAFEGGRLDEAIAQDDRAELAARERIGARTRRQIPTSPAAIVSLSRAAASARRAARSRAQRLAYSPRERLEPTPSRSGTRPVRTSRRRSRSRRTGTGRAPGARSRQRADRRDARCRRELRRRRHLAALRAHVHRHLAAQRLKAGCISAEIERACARSAGSAGQGAREGVGGTRRSRAIPDRVGRGAAPAPGRPATRRAPARRTPGYSSDPLLVERESALAQREPRSQRPRRVVLVADQERERAHAGFTGGRTQVGMLSRASGAPGSKPAGSSASAARVASEISTPPIGAIFCRCPATSSTGL